MKIFDIADFKYNNKLSESLNNLSYIEWEAIVSIANAKLKREGKMMYASGKSLELNWTNRRYSSDSYQALLIAIEPINPCNHPFHKIKTIGTMEWKCECGAYVIPTKFQETK